MAERAALLLLALLGVYALLLFGDFWFDPGHRRGVVLFSLLSFAVFWRPVRSLYDWWLYLWADPATGAPVATAGGEARVDVLTTAMPGEPRSMIVSTLEAIAAMEGVHQRFLLDGGDDPELRAACARLGVTHLDCRGLPGAKAGKVNHCLREASRAEFLLVIDPDHVPRPDFVTRVLPWFSDPKVGFVQVVQAYYNLRRGWVAWAAAEQTFGFYGPTLMGLQGLGLPTAIGANCTFRRAALDAIGGHAEHLAEDALTSMRIHAAGYRSVYLPWRGSTGVVPEDLTSFWKQQLKWAAGMSNLLVRHYPRLFRRFSALGRLHYLVAGTYYAGALATVMNLWLPVLFLFAGVFAVEISVTAFLVHFAPFATVSLAIHLLVQRWYTHREERGIPWRAMLLERATWHIYLAGFLSGILGLRIPYVPTPKGARASVPWRLLFPHLLLVGASVAAIAWALGTYHRLESGTGLMIALAAANALLLLPAIVTGLARPDAPLESSR